MTYYQGSEGNANLIKFAMYCGTALSQLLMWCFMGNILLHQVKINCCFIFSLLNCAFYDPGLCSGGQSLAIWMGKRKLLRHRSLDYCQHNPWEKQSLNSEPSTFIQYRWIRLLWYVIEGKFNFVTLFVFSYI